MLNKTPAANCPHLAIFGPRNAGKSSLFNAVIGQDIAVVSDIKGTTTDPVWKKMELLPLGPVMWIDTAGIDDEGVLGSLRVEKAKKIIERTDFAIYVMPANEIDKDGYKDTLRMFKRFNIPHMLVINKVDLVDQNTLETLKASYADAHFISANELEDIHNLKDQLIERLKGKEEDPSIIAGVVPYGGTVLMVVPIDSEAPKGRIILPQVQLIRDCLDNGIKSYVVRDTELEEALEDLKHIDLVVTDSQAFGEVSKIVPSSIALTSFSILFSRHKGELKSLYRGIEAIKGLEDGDRILIAETCTHNHSHEDIGRVKIPRWLKETSKKELSIEFSMGHDFPLDLEDYALVIHCGACMVNRKTMLNRIQLCDESSVPMTNYGMAIAHFKGILDRSLAMFVDEL